MVHPKLKFGEEEKENGEEKAFSSLLENNHLLSYKAGIAQNPEEKQNTLSPPGGSRKTERQKE